MTRVCSRPRASFCAFESSGGAAWLPAGALLLRDLLKTSYLRARRDVARTQLLQLLAIPMLRLGGFVGAGTMGLVASASQPGRIFCRAFPVWLGVDSEAFAR